MKPGSLSFSSTVTDSGYLGTLRQVVDHLLKQLDVIVDSTHGGVTSSAEQSSNTVPAASPGLSGIIWRTATVVVVHLEHVGDVPTDRTTTSLVLNHLLETFNGDAMIPLKVSILTASRTPGSVTRPLFGSGEPLTALSTLLQAVFVQVVDVESTQRLPATHLIDVTLTHPRIQPLDVGIARAPPDVARLLGLLVFLYPGVTVPAQTVIAGVTVPSGKDLLSFKTRCTRVNLIGRQNTAPFDKLIVSRLRSNCKIFRG